MVLQYCINFLYMFFFFIFLTGVLTGDVILTAHVTEKNWIKKRTFFQIKQVKGEFSLTVSDVLLGVHGLGSSVM